MDEKLKEYRDMQRQFYDDAAGGMRVSNHDGHSDNPVTSTTARNESRAILCGARL